MIAKKTLDEVLFQTLEKKTVSTMAEVMTEGSGTDENQHGLGVVDVKGVGFEQNQLVLEESRMNDECIFYCITV